MKSLKHHLISIILVFLYSASLATSQPKYVGRSCDDHYGSYSSNSTYKTNLNALLSSIASNTPINYGFYNLSIGENTDKVHGMALCRGDLSMTDCHSCIRAASNKITRECVSQETAIVLYQTCMLKYSIVNILKGVQFDNRHNDSSGKIGQVRDQMSFNRTISTLLMNLTNQAALGDYRRKFATGDAQVEGNEQLRAYALVQCTPNLEEFDCFNCLRILINFTLSDCCYGRQGAWVFVPSCSIKYDKYQFYNSTNALPPLKAPSPTPSSLSLPPHSIISGTKGNRSKKSTVVAIILPTTTPLLLLLILACHYLRRRRKPLEKIENEDEDKTVVVDSLKMDFDIIKAATDNFSDSNRLGYGGFGAVYKGRLSNGQAIAVKRLNKTSGQGRQEFRNEALLMAKLQHRNLLRFIGFCIQKDEKLLIHELLPNKSLDYFLFDPNKRIYLDWQKRYNIIQGIARGLLYLHEESRLLVIHRDLKPSNILLDMEMNPKISDFGMARIFGADQSQANTSKIIGTYGYMPPEYVSHGQFSIKTDVFSFGVLVLEIVSGQKVSGSSEADNGESLLSLAWRGWLEGNALSLVDSTMSDVNAAQVLRCINIGLLCVQENAAQRPIMSSVVLMLNSYTVTVPVASRPAFQAQSDGESGALNLTKQMNS